LDGDHTDSPRRRQGGHTDDAPLYSFPRDERRLSSPDITHTPPDILQAQRRDSPDSMDVGDDDTEPNHVVPPSSSDSSDEELPGHAPQSSGESSDDQEPEERLDVSKRFPSIQPPANISTPTSIPRDDPATPATVRQPPPPPGSRPLAPPRKSGARTAGQEEPRRRPPVSVPPPRRGRSPARTPPSPTSFLHRRSTRQAAMLSHADDDTPLLHKKGKDGEPPARRQGPSKVKILPPKRRPAIVSETEKKTLHGSLVGEVSGKRNILSSPPTPVSIVCPSTNIILYPLYRWQTRASPSPFSPKTRLNRPSHSNSARIKTL
jgi:hypothetical protein